MYQCCVCKKSRQDVVLHHFPCSEKRLAMWLKCLNRVDFMELPRKQLLKLLICQNHFEKRWISSNYCRSRLLSKAYPTLFTEDEIASGIPHQGNDENIDSQKEHNYSRKREHFDHNYCRQEPFKEILASVVRTAHVDLPGTSQIVAVNHDAEITGCGLRDICLPGPSQTIPVSHNGEIIGCGFCDICVHLPGTSQIAPASHDAEIVTSVSGTADVHIPETSQTVPVSYNAEIIASGYGITYVDLSGTSQAEPVNHDPEIIASGFRTVQAVVPGASQTTLVNHDADGYGFSDYGIAHIDLSGAPQTEPVNHDAENDYGSSDMYMDLPETSQNSPATRDTENPATSSHIVKAKNIKGSSRKIIKSVKDLNPASKMLYKEYRKARRQAEFYKKASQAKNNFKATFDKITKKMNPYAKQFIEMQINLCNKKKKGRRFTTDEKLIALAIMKQSPKCYKFLHKIFILPSTVTLNEMIGSFQQNNQTEENSDADE